MSKNQMILGTVVVLGMLSVFMFSDFYKNYKNKGTDNQFISSNILYITQPVTSFSGKVEKIEGNAVSVSSQYSLPQTAPIVITVIPGQPPIMPTPQVKTITYKLLITGKTQISQPPLNVNYLFKTTTPPGAPALPAATTTSKLTIKDIKVGQNITMSSQTDLRVLSGDMFEAMTINLPQIANTLNGKIVNIEGNTLTLKAPAPISGAMGTVNAVAGSSQEKEYRINMTSDTEISRMSPPVAVKAGEMPQPPQNEKLALSDLKKDMQVTVYTAQDVIENKELTALRIEPMNIQTSQISPLAPSSAFSPSEINTVPPGVK